VLFDIYLLNYLDRHWIALTIFQSTTQTYSSISR